MTVTLGNIDRQRRPSINRICSVDSPALLHLEHTVAVIADLVALVLIPNRQVAEQTHVPVML